MRAQYRKVVVYVAGDADAMSFLGMLGFGPVPVPTEEQKAVSMLLAGVAKAASGDTSSRQMRAPSRSTQMAGWRWSPTPTPGPWC